MIQVYATSDARVCVEKLSESDQKVMMVMAAIFLAFMVAICALIYHWRQVCEQL